MTRLMLRLDALANGGEAVGRAADGKVVFVDGGVPGDEVEVELTEDKSKFARGKVSRVVTPGADRVEPPCRYALRCGGCPWQIVSDDAQRSAKESFVARALQRTGAVILPLLVAPAQLGYRQRVTMYAGPETIGFFARRTHQLVDIDTCIALDPRLDAVITRIKPALAKLLRTDDSLRGTVVPSGAVQLAVSVAGANDARVRELAEQWVRDGIADGIVVSGDRERTVFGEALLDDGEAGTPHWISALGFRQANHEQNVALRHLVAGALEVSGQDLLELFAGDGNFTRDAVGKAKRIVAVEEDREAVSRLRKSLPTVDAVAARAEQEIVRRVAAGESFSRVLLDPPRMGAKDVMAPLARLRPARIVYVSCDPATLARDLRLLVDADYRVEWATPVDMMPHTDHVETVVKLSRATLRP